MVESLTYVYTSRDEIERIFSESGVALRFDDDFSGRIVPDSGEDDALNEILYEATDHLNLYLEQWYDPASMVNNRWIRRQASWVACYFTSQRLGNPEQFSAQFNRITELLTRMGQTGRPPVPRLPRRHEGVPQLSNQVVDDQYTAKKLRTQSSISTGANDGHQDVDWWHLEGY